MSARTRRTAWLILGLTWLAFVFRVGGLTDQSLWRDEVDALRFATQDLPALLEMFRRHGENGPLFFLVLRPWLQVAGSSEFALRFPSAAMGALAVPVVYVLLRRLTRSHGAAVIAALLLATAPYAVWYGQEAKMYAALLLWMPLTIYLTLQASWLGGWLRWLLLYAVTSVGFYLHLLAALAIPVQALWLMAAPSLAPQLHWRWTRQRRLIGLLYLALLTLPYLPLARWQAPALLHAEAQTGYPFAPLPTILLVMLAAFGRGILPVTDPIVLAPVVLAGLAGVGIWGWLGSPSGSPTARQRWTVVGLLGAWLILPAVGIYLISLRRPIFADRYLIWTLPAFLGLVGLGVTVLARAWRPLALAMLAALVALNVSAIAEQTVRPIKSDFRAAARFVMSHRETGDGLLFQIPYGRYTFSYYAGAIGQWLDGPYTNHGMSAAELDAVLTQATAALPAVWLIATETAMWDARDLTEAWLRAHGRPTVHAGFARVAVTRYQLR